MKNDYDVIPHRKIREMLLNGIFKHENLYQSDYESLLAYEMVLAESSPTVIDFCLTGLKTIEEYKDFNDVQICAAAEENKHKRKEERRELLLNGNLEYDSMSQYELENIFENESELFEPNITVLEFCVTGLRQFDKYKDLEDIQIYSTVLFKPVQGWEKRYATPRRHFRIHRRAAIAVIAIITTLLIATTTAAAFGYNFLDLIRNALNTSEGVSTDYDGNQILLKDEIRFYNSFIELLETEQLNILYPASLPEGYNFTNFEVDDSGDYPIILAFTSEPHISFKVRIGANKIFDNYMHESNGIKYNILERDGMYQAEWSNNTDYYWIVVGDRAVLSDIINNLTGEINQ